MLPAFPFPHWIAQGHRAPVLVGYSGGLDSTVLLHRLAADPTVRADGLHAVHVHHGLQADADRWARHAQHTCDVLGVPLHVVRVDVDCSAGTGLEAAARRARYAAFARHLEPGAILALAHHQDDQAETFLLRALRGSGIDGLAAMQPWRAHGGGWLWRPLLATPRGALFSAARAHALHWIEDGSNAGLDADRNFLRNAVLPVLHDRWPHAAASIARSARLAAEAQELLGADDAAALAEATAGALAVLDVAALQGMPAARRARVLRHWLATLGLPPLPAEGVVRIGSMLDATARRDSEACFDYSGTRVQRWRDLLHAGPLRGPLPPGLDLAWDGAASLALPGGGRLRLEARTPVRFERALRVHARRGGERIRLPGRGHDHSLKQVLQMQAVPRWRRAHLPLLSMPDGGLAAAGDIAVSAALAGWLEAHGARLCWDPPPGC